MVPVEQSETIAPILVPQWADLPWLVHGFSTRLGGATMVYRGGKPGGDLNLGFTASDDLDNVRANRERFVGRLAGEASIPLVTLRQIHSAIIHRVDERAAHPSGSQAVLEGDGLMTDTPGVLLGIQTADCVPVLLVDAERRAVAAFHAGWRGTLARIVEQGVRGMQHEFGSSPEDLRAAIGPAIGVCCYTVGDEVRERFVQAFDYAGQLFSSDSGTTTRLNLAEANRQQLLAAGLEDEAITLAHACTHCDTDRFFSHRAENGFTGRMLAVIGRRRD